MKALRIFIAIRLQAAEQKALEKALPFWATTIPEIHWLNSKNFHITLVFLASVAENQIPKLKNCCQITGKRHTPFMIHLGELDFFPSREHPQMIWLGIEKGQDSLQRLQRDLSRDIAQAGFVLEQRKFIPHLTLARIQQPAEKIMLKKIQDLKVAVNLPLEVNEISLIQSQLFPEGAQHTVLQNFPLTKLPSQ